MSAGEVEPCEARAERRLALLEEMAEIGMNLLRRTPSEMDDDKAADQFAKLSRAVRLTLALEEKTARFLAELQSGGLAKPREAPPASPSGDGRKLADTQRKADAFDLLVAISESEGESLESFERLCDAVDERFAEVDPAAPSEAPLAPRIERLCRDLGLTPEVSRRVGEGWSAGCLAGRPPLNPERQPPGPPLGGDAPKDPALRPAPA
jgi:hypothetical protein